MKKSDLKTGYIVEVRSGRRALIVKDNCYGDDAVVFAENNWTPLEGFDNHLFWHGYDPTRTSFATTMDVVKVYKPDLPTGFLSRTSKFADEMELIWERKEENIITTIDGVDYSESTLRSLIKKATS